jgi:predicted transcriptional regulator
MLYSLSMAKTLTAVRFKDRDLEALAKIAKREDETVSSLIRRAVEEFVKRMERKGKAA